MSSGRSFFPWWFLLFVAVVALLDLYLDRAGPDWWVEIDRGVTWLICAVLAALIWTARQLVRALLRK